MKQIYFLAGLPRTGNTLLSSLLNQNPLIYSSPLSPVCDHMCFLHKSILDNPHIVNSDYQYRTENVLRRLIHNHYEDVKKPIIFDREKAWGTPFNLNLIKTYITDKPKILFTTRPIVEILTSFLLIDEKLASKMLKSGWEYNNELSVIDNVCDYLMRPEGEISHALYALEEIKKDTNKNIFHVIDYNSLTTNPQQTMQDIYTFLEFDNFNHNFENIQKIESEDTTRSITELPANLHEVRPQLNKISKNPKDILSKYVLDKYGNR